MSLIMRLEGAQAAAAVNAGAATTLSEARGVYCYQSGSTARLITVQDPSSGSDVVVGTITLPAAAGSQLYLAKNSHEEIFAANAEVLFTPFSIAAVPTSHY